MNASGSDSFSYAFIDHLKQADGWFGPNAGSYNDVSFSNYVDSNGWPNTAGASGRLIGGGPRIPGSDEFAGPYVLTWTGDGTVQIQGLPSGGAWTLNTTSSAGDTTGTFTWNGSNTFTTVVGQTARVILNLSGCPGPILINVGVSATGGADGHVQNLKFYRLEDEVDLLAGKVFRSTFKQAYVANNPHHIRFLDWTLTNDNLVSRFEHRNKPSFASYFSNFGALGQPAYGSTSGTRAYTLSSATGMPVAVQHGEMVTCRIGNTVTGPSGGQITITGILKEANARVTAPSHGFTTGDIIIHHMWDGTPGGAPAGMTQLNNVPCTITVVDANTYRIGIDTSAYTTFTAGVAYEYVTLDVGSRGAYPVVFNDGVSPITRFGSSYLTANNYMTFTFDKLLVCSTTVNGAWVARKAGGVNVLNDGVPLEI